MVCVASTSSPIHRNGVPPLEVFTLRPRYPMRRVMAAQVAKAICNQHQLQVCTFNAGVHVHMRRCLCMYIIYIHTYNTYMACLPIRTCTYISCIGVCSVEFIHWLCLAKRDRDRAKSALQYAA